MSYSIKWRDIVQQFLTNNFNFISHSTDWKSVTNVRRHYWQCPHGRSMRSRVYATVGRPSVCPSVPSFGRRTPLLRVWCCGPGGQEIYIEWSDVTEFMVTIRSPFCGYDQMRCVKYRVYSNKIESFSIRKCSCDHWLTNKTYLSAIAMTYIYQSFTYKIAAKINWHRYVTKLRHYHPMHWSTTALPARSNSVAAARHAAANAGSATLSADVGSWTQELFRYCKYQCATWRA